PHVAAREAAAPADGGEGAAVQPQRIDAGSEIGDAVRIRGGGGDIEDECVGAQASGQRVVTAAAGQRVVAVAAGERVVRAVAGNQVLDRIARAVHGPGEQGEVVDVVGQGIARGRT